MEAVRRRARGPARRRIGRLAGDLRAVGEHVVGVVGGQVDRGTEDTPLPFDLPAVCHKKLTVDFNDGTQSSDGGLLLLRAAERKLDIADLRDGRKKSLSPL